MNTTLDRLAANHDRVANEGGEGHNPFRDQMEQQAAASAAARQAAFDAEWTRETTVARRKAWNDLMSPKVAVIKVAPKAKHAAMMVEAQREVEAAVGHTVYDLKRAVQSHGL